MASFTLSERQAAQLDNSVVPPGGDRRVEPGLWSMVRRLLLNTGTASVLESTSAITVTLPAPMPSTDFTVFATIVDDAGRAAAMSNSPAHIVAKIDSVSQITLTLVDAGGSVQLVPPGETLNLFWCVRE